MQRRKQTAALALLVAFIFTMGVTAAAPLVKPQPAQAGILPDPCRLIPSQVLSDLCQGGSGSIGGTIPGLPSPGGVVSKIVGETANAVLAPVINQFVQLEGRTVINELTNTANNLNSQTTPNMLQPWFLEMYMLFFGLVAIGTVAIYYFRIPIAVKNKSFREGGLATLSLFQFFLIGMILPWAVTMAVKGFDDYLTPAYMNAVKQVTSDQLTNVQVDFTKQMSLLNNPAADLLRPLLYLLVGWFGGFLMEIIFYIRQYLLYIFTGAEILALAFLVMGRVGERTFYKITGALVALIPLKFVGAVLLLFALKLISAATGDAIVLATIGLLAVPLVLLWFIKIFTGFDPQLTRHAATVRAAAAMA
jgi:hypothetical protein